MGVVQKVKEEWGRFKRDEPGKRFIGHYHRAQKNKSVGKTVLSILVGLVLLGAGIFMWFVPGPGWLFVFFGLAMFAGQSQVIARFLDRLDKAILATCPCRCQNGDCRWRPHCGWRGVLRGVDNPVQIDNHRICFASSCFRSHHAPCTVNYSVRRSESTGAPPLFHRCSMLSRLMASVPFPVPCV